MAMAPELFIRENALKHLKISESNLLEPKSYGIKTLDRYCDEYVAYYDNANDSDNPKIAQGFSYHNGPEWIWVYAYFLKAMIRMKFDDPMFGKEQIMSYLATVKVHLRENDWYSLPELTNANGEFNSFSCPA